MLQPRILSVELANEMNIVLKYETGEKKRFDVSAYADGPWYGMLKDPDYFRTVRLVPGGTGIEWPEGQDIAPHELYELGETI